jgi:integrase/recombinase XerD
MFIRYLRSQPISGDRAKTGRKSAFMAWSLYDSRGRRKYLTPAERADCIRVALRVGGKTGAFCAVIAFCGPRISEALALTPERLDDGNCAISFETLKRRQRGIIRAVPVPIELLNFLDDTLGYRKLQSDPVHASARLWPWCRTTGWKRVREVMTLAKLPVFLRTPKALRHAFGIIATDQWITLGIINKWLGHAKLETTEIYSTPIGQQERALAKLTWRNLQKEFPRRSA